MPTHIPALKISPINSQLLKLSITVNASKSGKREYRFIKFSFSSLFWMQNHATMDELAFLKNKSRNLNPAFESVSLHR